MDWNRTRCIELIEQYEKYPQLWNPKHGLYYNKTKKQDAWGCIAEAMGCSTEEVKKKMESILASFRREKAKGRKIAGSDKALQDVYTSQWFAFSRMAFLLDRAQRKSASKPSLSFSLEDDQDESISNEATESTGGEPDPLGVKLEVLDNYLESTVEESQQDIQPSVHKRPRFLTPEMEIKKRMTQEDCLSVDTLPLLGDFSDPCTDYVKHVGNKLRTYSDRVRSIVQYHINNIIFQADMGHFATNMEPLIMTPYPSLHNMTDPAAEHSHCTTSASTLSSQDPNI